MDESTRAASDIVEVLKAIAVIHVGVDDFSQHHGGEAK